MTFEDHDSQEKKSSLSKDSESSLSQFLGDKSEISPFIQSFDKIPLFKNLSESDVFEIKVCLEELLINVFNYGYSEKGQPPRIEVLLYKQENIFIIEITDNAAPFNPLSENYEPILKKNLKTRRIGGVGIHLVKELSDAFEYYPTVSGNRVVIKKELTEKED